VRKCGRLVTHELHVSVSSWWWRWRWSLVHLGLHVGDSVRHVGEQLSLGSEKLLHPYWRCLMLLILRRIGDVVVIARSPTWHCWLIDP